MCTKKESDEDGTFLWRIVIGSALSLFVITITTYYIVNFVIEVLI